MPANYEAISKKNELELGTKLKSRRTQISLYADPTHFVYELLQNADDHGAKHITFRLKADGLTVEHNATERFEKRHVAAISSFEDSTSEDEWLSSRASREEKPPKPFVPRCPHCGGELRLRTITDGAGRVLLNRALPNHGVTYLDSG